MQVLKVFKGCKVPKARLDLKVLKAFKALKVFKVLKAT
jgi:hypothetical protein